jgi:nucleotide-binding universal stress UspA family protein
MRWILGVDAMETAGGAVAFADWLVRWGASQKVFPVHILEAFDNIVPGPHTAQFRDWAQLAASELLGQRKWGKLATLEAFPAEVGLARAIKDLGAGGLIIGRRATTSGSGLVRLGRVARRLARELPAPVVVVPRDYSPAIEPRDPIVLATDLSNASVAAAGFAVSLAVDTDRPLLVVHCVEGPEPVAAYLPGATWVGAYRNLQATGASRLEQWCAANGLEHSQHRILDGPPVPAVLTVTRQETAAMVVVGSRQLGPVDRFFVSSTASDLAARSSVPVAIVPPD